MLLQIPEGVTIIKEGEVNNDMYKIVNGNAEVYSGYGTDKEALIGILSKGSYFGEIGLLSQNPAIYTVIAYSDILVQRISMADINDYILHNHHDVLEIMQHMASTMYSLKYTMDMVLDDMALSNDNQRKDLNTYKAYFSKQFAKYSIQNIQPSFNQII